MNWVLIMMVWYAGQGTIASDHIEGFPDVAACRDFASRYKNSLDQNNWITYTYCVEK